jgi:hypothetical protein
MRWISHLRGQERTPAQIRGPRRRDDAPAAVRAFEAARATFINGELVERPGEDAESEAA